MIYNLTDKWLIIQDALPDMPLTGGMGHQSIVSPDGEVIATVWNHHHHRECLERATAILKVLRDG